MRRLLPMQDFPEAFANYVHSLQCVCEWAERPALFARLQVGGGAGRGARSAAGRRAASGQQGRAPAGWAGQVCMASLDMATIAPALQTCELACARACAACRPT